MTAAGVLAGTPCSRSWASADSSVSTDIKITSVPAPLASLAQATRDHSRPASSLPVMTAKEDDTRRSVTGMPA